MHPRGDAADFSDGASEERLVDVRIEGRERPVLWRRRRLTAAALAAPGSGTLPGARAGAAASATSTESAHRTIELERLPRTEALADLLGELRRIRRRAERLGRQDRRRLMVLSAARPSGLIVTMTSGRSVRM